MYRNDCKSKSFCISKIMKNYFFSNEMNFHRLMNHANISSLDFYTWFSIVKERSFVSVAYVRSYHFAFQRIYIQSNESTVNLNDFTFKAIY